MHSTLPLILATFMFLLTVLRSIRSDGVIALVFFLAHLATQIRVEVIAQIFLPHRGFMPVDLAGSEPGARGSKAPSPGSCWTSSPRPPVRPSSDSLKLEQRHNSTPDLNTCVHSLRPSAWSRS